MSGKVGEGRPERGGKYRRERNRVRAEESVVKTGSEAAWQSRESLERGLGMSLMVESKTRGDTGRNQTK